LLLAMLERYGAEVSVAASAGDALHQLQRGSFDILLADIGMPDQDGFALIRAIRSLPGPERNLPAVAVTAYASRRESALALEAGYGWHLPKPVQPELLLATVCTAIESGTAAGRGDSTTGRPARSRTVRKSRSRTEPRRKKNAS
jgi:CheY-like chemotaxis protein